MPKYLMFKSRVKSIYDYSKTDLTEFLPEFTPDEKTIEKDTNRLLTAYGKKICADTVSQGDMAVICCESENRKFNKKSISVSVGKGLFSIDFESKLIGMKVGEKYTITADGSNVSVCIKSAEHTVMPELCDEEVSGWGIKSIKTVGDLRKYCINKQLDKFLDDCKNADMASAYVSQITAENSEIELCREEVDMVVASMKKRMSNGSESTADVGIDEKMLEKICIDSFKIAVIGNLMCEQENKLLKQEDYENAIKNIMLFDESITKEKAKEDYTLFDFMNSNYGDTYSKRIDVYVKEFFKRKLNS